MAVIYFIPRIDYRIMFIVVISMFEIIFVHGMWDNFAISNKYPDTYYDESYRK